MAGRADQGDRLRLAREAHYDSATEAAEAHGWVPSTYLGHENGSRGFTKSARRYAHAFGVELEWLLEGTGPRKKGQRDPLISRIERLPIGKRRQLERLLDALEPDNDD